MGAWGENAYDNDSAADWFGDSDGLRAMQADVLEVLRREPEGDWDYDRIRASAWLVVQTGRAYVWEYDTLDEALALAIKRLEHIRDDGEYVGSWVDPDKFTRNLTADLETLRARAARMTHA